MLTLLLTYNYLLLLMTFLQLLRFYGVTTLVVRWQRAIDRGGIFCCLQAEKMVFFSTS